MSNRYEIRHGKWGAYFHDDSVGEDMPLEMVRDRLNAGDTKYVSATTGVAWSSKEAAGKVSAVIVDGVRFQVIAPKAAE